MGTLAVDNIQHTDGSSAVTLNNATITAGTIPAAGITGTLGSGVTISTLGLVFLGSVRQKPGLLRQWLRPYCCFPQLVSGLGH